jgi:uncharacterized protein YndB with AHSA1/START domain
MKLALVTAAALAAPFFWFARAPRSAASQSVQPPVMVLTLLEHGPNWPASPDAATMQKLGEHRDYILRYFADGSLLAGGPALDFSCGIEMWALSDHYEVERIVANDPAVKAGLFKPEFRLFNGMRASDFVPRATLPPAPAGLAPIRHEMLIAAPLADVWKAWSTAEGQQTFFAPHVELELAPLGRYEVQFFPDNPKGQRGGEDLRVLSYVPERMVSFEWNAPPNYPNARAERTFFAVELEPLSAKSTRVVITHLGMAERAAARPELADEWKGVRAYFDQAWSKVLERLQRRFVSGPLDLPAEFAAPKAASAPTGGKQE